MSCFTTARRFAAPNIKRLPDRAEGDADRGKIGGKGEGGRGGLGRSPVEEMVLLLHSTLQEVVLFLGTHCAREARDIAVCLLLHGRTVSHAVLHRLDAVFEGLDHDVSGSFAFGVVLGDLINLSLLLGNLPVDESRLHMGRNFSPWR